MHLKHLVLLAALLAATFACKSPSECTKITRRKVFFIVNRTQGVYAIFSWITPFIKVFKNVISRSLYVSFESTNVHVCPLDTSPPHECTTPVVNVNTSWTNDEYDEAVYEAYKGTSVFIYPTDRVANLAGDWADEKQYELHDKCASALVVFISGAEEPDWEADLNEIAKQNKKENLEFFGVHLNISAPFNFEYYKPLISDETHIAHVSAESELNEELAKRIVNA